MVAGAEGLLIGAFIVVAATLLFTNVWTVLDARAASGEAATAAARAYVEADVDPVAAAEAAARTVLAERHRTAVSITVTAPGFSRCAPVVVTVVTEVPRLAVPGLGGAGTFTVTATHRSWVDPYRSSGTLTAEAHCA